MKLVRHMLPIGVLLGLHIRLTLSLASPKGGQRFIMWCYNVHVLSGGFI